FLPSSPRMMPKQIHGIEKYVCHCVHRMMLMLKNIRHRSQNVILCHLISLLPPGILPFLLFRSIGRGLYRASRSVRKLIPLRSQHN
ncbi:Unknown protein, partial [Striga hermonthica]